MLKIYRTPIILGIILALLFGAVSWAGYSVVFYYTWLFIIFLLFLLAAPIVKREPSVMAYLVAVVILVAASLAGVLAGHGIRQLHCRLKCRACEPLLESLQKQRAENGCYPTNLMQVPDFARLQREAGLRISQGQFLKCGIDLKGINSNDALIYLSTNCVACVVPVTKQLFMSVTRLYVYAWNSNDRCWKYEKVIWVPYME